MTDRLLKPYRPDGLACYCSAADGRSNFIPSTLSAHVFLKTINSRINLPNSPMDEDKYKSKANKVSGTVLFWSPEKEQRNADKIKRGGKKWNLQDGTVALMQLLLHLGINKCTNCCRSLLLGRGAAAEEEAGCCFTTDESLITKQQNTDIKLTARIYCDCSNNNNNEKKKNLQDLRPRSSSAVCKRKVRIKWPPCSSTQLISSCFMKPFLLMCSPKIHNFNKAGTHVYAHAGNL